MADPTSMPLKIISWQTPRRRSHRGRIQFLVVAAVIIVGFVSFGVYIRSAPEIMPNWLETLAFLSMESVLGLNTVDIVV